jgi:hypothetical protein
VQRLQAVGQTGQLGELRPAGRTRGEVRRVGGVDILAGPRRIERQQVEMVIEFGHCTH